MKKIYLLATALLVAFAFTAQNDSPNIESFEGSVTELANCWTSIDADGDGVEWEPFNDAGWPANTGDGIMRSSSWNGAPLTPDNYLILPQVTPGTNEHLTFWVAGQDPAYSLEKYAVMISTTGAAEADFTINAWEETLADENWVERTVDLSAYEGQDIYIAIRHYDVTDQFYIKLDDVQFPTTTDAACVPVTSITEFDDLHFGVYPNPAEDVLFVESDLKDEYTIELINSIGQTVYSKLVMNSGITNIDLTSFDTGLYTIRLNDGATLSQTTIVIR